MNLRATILGCVLLLPPSAVGACHEVKQVDIQMIDEAGVPPLLLTNALRETTWLLTSLCVQPRWSFNPGGEGLEIHILLTPLAADTGTNCLGLAIPDFGKGNRGAVFMSRVRKEVANHRDLIDTKMLLGAVLAHEIGHLLLHTREHSDRGIMQANFGERQLRMAYQRRLTFTDSDRQAVSRKLSAALPKSRQPYLTLNAKPLHGASTP